MLIRGIETELQKFKREAGQKITCSTRLTPEAITDPFRRSWIFSINQSSNASPIPSCKTCLATQKAFLLYCTQV